MCNKAFFSAQPVVATILICFLAQKFRDNSPVAIVVQKSESSWNFATVLENVQELLQ
jgi:hypothetical protein